MIAAANVSNSLRAALANDGIALTLLIKRVTSPEVAKLARDTGHDALYIDLEFGLIAEADVEPIAQRALAIGITCLVRLPGADPDAAARLLARGVGGIVVPKVETLDQARASAAVCASAPQVRGAAPVLVIMLESAPAVALADAMAALDGVDILHVGTGDLARSLGASDRFSDPRVEAALVHVATAARRHGKAAGAGGLGEDTQVQARAIQNGLRFLTTGNEWACMAQAAAARASSLRRTMRS